MKPGIQTLEGRKISAMHSARTHAKRLQMCLWIFILSVFYAQSGLTAEDNKAVDAKKEASKKN